MWKRKSHNSRLPSLFQLQKTGPGKRPGHTAAECKACRNCGMLNHSTSDCTKVECRKCRKWGHRAADCIKCGECGKPGHQASDCRKALNRRRTGLALTTSSAGSSYRSSSSLSLSPSSPSCSSSSPSSWSDGSSTWIPGTAGIYGVSVTRIDNKTGRSYYYEMGANEI